LGAKGPDGACQRAAHQGYARPQDGYDALPGIAELLRHGLLRGSYVPPPIIRDLRDLTRTRATLSQEQSSISRRIQKLLESANIMLASTVTHTMGKSGRAMLEAIVSGEDSPERLADLALGKLRSKTPQLQLALEGRIRDHHRFLLDSRQLPSCESFHVVGKLILC
jgi:transposase